MGIIDNGFAQFDETPGEGLWDKNSNNIGPTKNDRLRLFVIFMVQNMK